MVKAPLTPGRDNQRHNNRQPRRGLAAGRRNGRRYGTERTRNCWRKMATYSDRRPSHRLSGPPASPRTIPLSEERSRRRHEPHVEWQPTEIAFAVCLALGERLTIEQRCDAADLQLDAGYEEICAVGRNNADRAGCADIIACGPCVGGERAGSHHYQDRT